MKNLCDIAHNVSIADLKFQKWLVGSAKSHRKTSSQSAASYAESLISEQHKAENLEYFDQVFADELDSDAANQIGANLLEDLNAWSVQQAPTELISEGIKSSDHIAGAPKSPLDQDTYGSVPPFA